MKQEELIVLEATVCARCGIHFAVPETWLKARRADGTGFWCPNGHPLTFGDSTLEQLKKQLAEAEKKAQAAKREADQTWKWYKAEQGDHEHTRNRLRATKGVLTKTKKRVAAGVCPCCSRHFVNLERHMATKHADYTADNDSESSQHG